ncbi:hypothetical protein [Rubrivirga marina]|uniref:Uncharacterized protein n=1 Tax=Rubrivirga marina TaxID=1196024 RepID=A0A271J2H1_9BACT|nr:hypothetical protein [Rubrivirga marina]PAP77244.1 hypothetical protein BSZ37_12775 [Rubrivirga marina]
MRTSLLAAALALGAAALAPSADAQRRPPPRDSTDRVERRADEPLRSRQVRRPRFRSEQGARDHARRTREARRDTTDRARRDRAPHPRGQRARAGRPNRTGALLDTLALGHSEAAPGDANARRGRQQARRQRRGGPPDRDISTMQDIVPRTGQDTPPDEGGYIIDDWIWGAQDADREPRPEADGQAARTQSPPPRAGTTTVSGRRIGQNPAGPGGAPPSADDYDRADPPNDNRPDGYEYGVGYVVSGPTTPTLISGAGGPDQIDKEPGNGAMLYLVGGAEEADAPCAFLFGWARWNDPRNGRQQYFETTTDRCDDKGPWWSSGWTGDIYESKYFSREEGHPDPFEPSGDDARHVAGVPAREFDVAPTDPQPIRAAHAVQACLNRAGDRLKGLRIWGAHVGRAEPGSVEPDGALFGEFERPNCHEWAAKRSCPEGEVAIGVTVHGDEGREFEASGVSLTCAAPRPIDLAFPIYED